MEPTDNTSKRPARSIDGMGPTRRASGSTSAPLDLRKVAKPTAAAKSAPQNIPTPAKVQADTSLPQAEQSFDQSSIDESQQVEPATESIRPVRKRRFWRSFWRFLTTLLVLGFVVGAGYYVYVMYYSQR